MCKWFKAYLTLINSPFANFLRLHQVTIILERTPEIWDFAVLRTAKSQISGLSLGG